MLIDVVMPQMGESLAEGTVVRWLKKAGDRVDRDEPLFEISTDKVDTDVPSPAAGIVREIVVAEGQTVGVGTRVAVIEQAGDAKAAAPLSAAPGPAQPGPRPADSPPDAARTEEPAAHFKSAHAPQLVSFRRSGAAPAAGAPPAPRSFSPAVLESARRASVPLDALTMMKGSGRGGRITKADVARFVESGAAAAPAGRAPAAPVGDSVPPAYLYRPSADDQIVPMSPVRRRIADHMRWSVRISPHASAFAECDLTAVVDWLHRERDAFAARVGAPLTITVLAAAALVRAVREFPTFNASVVDEALAIKPRVHLGIAVALADTDELIVPVLRDADGLSLEGIARGVAGLAGRARDRRLRPEDVQGGTITLTNPGMFGGVTGTPILNQPQVAILGLGAIVRRAVVLEGDRIAPRSMMTLALTFDHRAADGVAAFRFLGRVSSLFADVPATTS
ncbi:MAG TPA: dihydrolipoamide acetyltransferase family protein [Vicinamibacterales bacterium]|nr:dihydrolipoamide acetyltransferase family protein [Vicinamibacterales bacterium]